MCVFDKKVSDYTDPNYPSFHPTDPSILIPYFLLYSTTRPNTPNTPNTTTTNLPSSTFRWEDIYYKNLSKKTIPFKE